jgi:hypothetical protein
MSNAAPLRNGSADAFWSTRREAAVNWLALGLLLAAWNATDNDAAEKTAAAHFRGRPAALRGYSSVSVRAVNRVAANIP